MTTKEHLIKSFCISYYLIFSSLRINLLTVFIPGIDPCTLTACKRITCHTQYFANRANAPRMQPFAFYVVGNIERGTLFDDIERTAITLQFTLTGAKGLYLFAVLVIDVIP